MAHKVGRNDPCPCGSGVKYKKCCEPKTGHKKMEATVLSGSAQAGKISSLFSKKVEQIVPKEAPAEIKNVTVT